MKRRELFKVAASLVAGAALAPVATKATASDVVPRGLMALNNGANFDTYFLGDDGVMMTTSASPREIDDAFREAMRQLAARR